MPASTTPGTVAQAVDLAMAVTRLRARMRSEGGTRGVADWSIAQLMVLRRVLEDGPMSGAALAAAEYVTPQAMAQTVAGLERAGLIIKQPDPADGRNRLVCLTDAARAVIASVNASRQAWLVRAIDDTIAPAERADLDRAIELLERLAAADLGPGSELW